MSAYVRKRGTKWRVVEGPKSSPTIVKNRAGTPVDGGGFKTKTSASAQARAINANQKKSSSS